MRILHIGYVAKRQTSLVCQTVCGRYVFRIEFSLKYWNNNQVNSKMIGNYLWYSGCILMFAALTNAAELTFELPDSAKECFHQEIHKNTTATLEFQVVTGGQYDVDVTLYDPLGKELYKQIKTQFDSHTFTAETTGVYRACFSNEFSTFSHKLVYMDFQVGEEKPLPGIGEHVTVMTQMESSAQDIHKSLNTIIDFQTHHRLREAQGRKRAEDLNERVLWWSCMETIAVIAIGVGQVFILKNFFTEKKPLNLK